MLEQYFARFKGGDVTVLGIGISNLPLIRLLAKAGANVTARDKRGHIDEAGELAALGVKLVLGAHYLQDLPVSTTFVTPGINPHRAEIAAIAARGAHITSEMDVFMSLCPCPVIGVTGSDGKTTTTTLICQMLKAGGKTAWIGGNIGNPLLDSVDQMSGEHFAVIEFSSFQLMTVSRSPGTAVITNISPNHLDVHTDMNEYIEAKRAIFANQAPGGTVILNADNDITARMAAQAPGKARMFSRRSKPEGGAWLEGGTICLSGTPVMTRADILLPGMHNAENYMAAALAVDGLVPNSAVLEVARSFPGVEHRLELARELDGVRYYNDSIGSSPSRTIAGLDCFDSKVLLIAGGYDKLLAFDELGAHITRRVKTLLLCGATAKKIEDAVKSAPGYAENCPRIERFDRLDDVVAYCRAHAGPGDVVLFSPACASFDQFKNFGERGKYFKALVNSLS